MAEKSPSKKQITAFEEACSEAFRKQGGRVTQPRLAVVRCVASSQVPLSAREIFEQVSSDKKLPNVDQVSVYRILEALSELGLVHQVYPSGGYMPCFHLRCGSELHVLIRCTSCDRIDEIHVPQEALAPFLYYLEEEQQFVPDDHLFQMNGTCIDCGSEA